MADDYEVPLVAIREAVANAIVHRDYSISGADIPSNFVKFRLYIIEFSHYPNIQYRTHLLHGSRPLGSDSNALNIKNRFFHNVPDITKETVLLERVMGIGPTQSAWKADVLPLNYTRGILERVKRFELSTFTLAR